MADLTKKHEKVNQYYVAYLKGTITCVYYLVEFSL